MSSTKRPAVAPTVPSRISLSWPENVSVKTLALEVDVEPDLRLDLHQRLARQAGGLEDDPAAQLDEERLALRDERELLRRRRVAVAGAVAPRVGGEASR